MATTITMPQLGETVTEGTVARWLKAPGDPVEKYEAFVEVSTDKVNAEVPSPVSGILREIVCQEGETVATGAPIAVIDEAATAGAPATTVAPGSDRVLSATPSSYGAPGSSNGTSRKGTENGNGNAITSDAAVLRGVSPAVRRLARERNVDVSAVSGTGHNGRVTADDVIAAAAPGTAAPAATAARVATTLAPAPPSPPAPARGPARLPIAGASTYDKPQRGTTISLSPARKIIAKRMVESLATAPHAWTMVEVDVTNAWTWRSREKDRFARERGHALTLLPFFIYAVARALEAQPLLNARFTDDGIVVHREINIGIAVGLDGNLMVPVIRDADTLTIGGLAVAAGKIIDRARQGTLGADELAGGTFTVNNTGANGSILSQPIINAGQAGIVTMEAVVKRPVVMGDAIAIRAMMNVCLSLDHRVIDGAVANAFLGDIKKRLEAMLPGRDL